MKLNANFHSKVNKLLIEKKEQKKEDKLPLNQLKKEREKAKVKVIRIEILRKCRTKSNILLVKEYMRLLSKLDN